MPLIVSVEEVVFFLYGQLFGSHATRFLLILHINLGVVLNLILDFEFVLHNLLLNLQLGGFLNKGRLLATSPAVNSILIAQVQIQGHFARIFSFKAKSVNHITFPLLVQVFGAHNLF